jgi:hypothetical protein
MENKNLIPVEQICSHYHIEVSFIKSLSAYGLIEIAEIEEIQYVLPDQIKDLEKMIRLHVDLDVNLEGIDVIYHLLRKMDTLHTELKSVKNQLHFYNPDDDKK